MITTEKIGCGYIGQDFNSLEDLSFEIPEGAVTLISGPTGSGKSTLGLMLCGAIPQLIHARVWGKTNVLGLDPSRIPVRTMARHMGYLMQNVEWQIFTDSVSDEVAFGLENFAVSAQKIPFKIDEALADTGTTHLKKRQISNLSAGERQRVVIASLLALDQKALILDEPLAYLDREGAFGLVRLLRQLAQKGKTIIVIEHRRDMLLPSVAMEIFIKNGRVARAIEARECFGVIGESGTTSNSLLLEFDKMCFSWDEKPLLEDISFEIRPGESVVLLGDNGSGKTTIFKIALGLLPQFTGEVRITGLDVRNYSTRKLAAAAALVLQNPDHQLHAPSVEKEIQWYAIDRESAEYEMRHLGLAGLEKRHPHSLSVGQKRCVTLAAALASKPRILLLDEPTVGQDDSSLELIFKRLEKFIDQGGAVLAATHDYRAARCLAHRTILLQNGKVTSGGQELVNKFFSAKNDEIHLVV